MYHLNVQYGHDAGVLTARYPQSALRAVYLDLTVANLGGTYENALGSASTYRNACPAVRAGAFLPTAILSRGMPT